MSYRADYNFVSRLDRAFQQRIYLIDCHSLSHDSLSNNSLAHDSSTCNKRTYEFEVMGNTGTVYDISLKEGGKIQCSCPDHDQNWKLCKHMLFVLIRILGINREIVYNDYFKMVEDARKSFNVTNSTIDLCSHYLQKREAMLLEGVSREDLSSGVKRKPIQEEDSCPICLEEFSSTKEKIDWCKGQCGNNVHNSCFVKWSKKLDTVSCVYCRSAWIW
jgi:hypothetical protein